MSALRAEGLGRRFGSRWALRGCTLDLPAGRIAALVGPNAAGKTTLMRLAIGLIPPSEGTISAPGGVSYLAQEKPLYPSLRVAEMLRAGAALNRRGRWDAEYARRLVDDAGIDPAARISELSGGGRSRVALALALARRPDLLLVDEPLSDLDPLARRQVMATLLAEVAETGMTVLMASHVIAELDGVCDHLFLLRAGQVVLAGAVEDLLAAHHHVSGPHEGWGSDGVVVERRAGRQVTALVRGAVVADPRLVVEPPTLEEMVLGYLEQDGVTA
jgi:ABC-2 type transport system ATP-binding protein